MDGYACDRGPPRIQRYPFGSGLPRGTNDHPLGPLIRPITGRRRTSSNQAAAVSPSSSGSPEDFSGVTNGFSVGQYEWLSTVLHSSLSSTRNVPSVRRIRFLERSGTSTISRRCP